MDKITINEVLEALKVIGTKMELIDSRNISGVTQELLNIAGSDLKIVGETDLEEKEERLQRLNNRINAFSKESNLRLLNQTVPVLVLGESEKDPTKVYGYTDTMKLVNVKAPKNTISKIIDVKITDAKSFSLDGEINEKIHS